MKPLFGTALVLVVSALALGCGGGGGSTPEPEPDPPGTLSSLRLDVGAAGLVKVPYATLQAAGLVQGAVPVTTLSLANQGQPMPLRAATADGSTFRSGDALEFFAPAMDTLYTGTNVFWLTQGTPSPMGTRSVAPGATAPLGAFQDLLHLEQNNLMWGDTPGLPSADPWFWLKLTAPANTSIPFTLPALDETSGASSLSFRVMGRTSGGVSPDHHLAVSLNGVPVGDLRWTGMTETVQALPLAAGILVAGANTLTLSLPGDTAAAVDAVLLNSIEVRSWRPLDAKGGALTFTLPANTAGPVRVDGFTSSDIRLLDVTDPRATVQLQGFTTTPSGSTWSLAFQDPSATARTYLATTPDAALAPSRPTGWTPGALRAATQGADYLLITPRAFLAAAEPLRKLRQDQDLRAVSVAMEDIYNEFGDGFPTPEALKAFLAFTTQSWIRPAPRFVLLLGDATYDYRNRTGTGKLSQVPCHLSLTEELGLTPDDNWFAALDGVDELPVLNLGRLPSASAAQAAQVVGKLVAYEQSGGSGSSKTLFVADNNEPVFQNLCDSLAAMVPSNLTAQKVYLGSYTDFTLASSDIVSAFNRGLQLSVYSGHGDVADWAGEQILDTSKVPLLTNAAQPAFSLIMNCLNGYFAMAGSYCLAETLVANPAGGSIGVFASSGLGYTWEQTFLGNRFMPLFFGADRPTLGEICTRAKVLAFQDGSTLDQLRTFTLIGDPAMRLKAAP